MLGKFSDRNLAWAAAFSGGDFVAGLPATNLAQAERFVERPARTSSLDPADTQFEVELERPRAITLVGLHFHNMSIGARYRLTVAGATGTLDDPLYESAWTDVYARLYPSSQLAWEEPNWWTGKPLAADLDLTRRHKHILLPEPLVASAIRVELDDQDNEAGFLDIGGCWIASGWSPECNFERGRELGLETRDLVEEGPSGRLFGQRRLGRRRLSVAWNALTEAEAYRLFDAGARAGTSQPVLFLPDADNDPNLYREGFPAVFERPPAPRFDYPHLNKVSATFREILA